MSGAAALSPFRTRSFRFQWPADLCTAWALEMETLILSWYVLVETGSVLLLTVFGSLQFVGTLVSPALGTLGDRFGLRNLLAAMRFGYLVFAGIILFLALGGRLSPPAVMGIAFLCGLLRSSDIGMRSALVGATIPPVHLVAAMGISRTTQDSARVGGALAGAGFMATFGMAPAYGLITVIYAVGIVLTLRVDDGAGARAGGANGRAAAPRPSAWHELVEGLIYVWRTPRLRAAMSVAMLVNLTAFPFTGGLMPYVARNVHHLDQRGLGWLVASFATGALLGSLFLSLHGARVRPARTMLAGCAAWHLALVGFVFSPAPTQAMLFLLAAGFTQSASMLALSIILLRTSEELFRGRSMVRRLMALSTLPFGLVVAGPLFPPIGWLPTAMIMLILGLALTAASALFWRRDLLPRDAPGNAR